MVPTTEHFGMKQLSTIPTNWLGSFLVDPRLHLKKQPRFLQSNFAQFIWKSILFCCRLGFFSNHIQWSKSKNKLKLIQCKSLITHFSTSIVSAFATYVRGIYPSSPVTKDFANHHSPVLWKKYVVMLVLCVSFVLVSHNVIRFLTLLSDSRMYIWSNKCCVILCQGFDTRDCTYSVTDVSYNVNCFGLEDLPNDKCKCIFRH